MIRTRTKTSPDNFQLRAFLKGYSYQRGTPLECHHFNRLYTCRDFNGFQCSTIRESAVIIKSTRIRIAITTTDNFQLRLFFKGYSCQRGASLKCSCFNRFYTCRDFNGFQCSTIRENARIIRSRTSRIVTTDSFQLRAFLKSHGCQRGASLKCSCFNRFYTCRDFNRGYRAE